MLVYWAGKSKLPFCLLRTSYQRLRTDHITALRSKGENKNLQLLGANYDALEARSKAIDETLVKLLQSHNIDCDRDNGGTL